MKNIFIKGYSIAIDGKSKSIALLTDIHYCNGKEKEYLYQVVETLKGLEYDYLCISGDLLDKGHVDREDWLLEWLTTLSKISKVIIGIGNHEQMHDLGCECAPNSTLYQKIKKIKNVVVLDNNTYVDGGIRFIGVTLPLDYYYKYRENKVYFTKYMNNIFPEAYTDKYNVLLCHTPIPLMDNNVIKNVHLFQNLSLILCGHMHGGLTPNFLWKIGCGRGIIGPYHSFFPKGAYGIYKKENTIIVVSSGITKISANHFISFFNRFFKKEITMVYLESKK